MPGLRRDVCHQGSGLEPRHGEAVWLDVHGPGGDKGAPRGAAARGGAGGHREQHGVQVGFTFAPGDNMYGVRGGLSILHLYAPQVSEDLDLSDLVDMNGSDLQIHFPPGISSEGELL